MMPARDPARPVSRAQWIAIAAVLALAAAIQAASYWPGIITWDALNQFGQARTGDYDDWHPPVMAWIWRRLLGLSAGPAPMLVLQLALSWTGYALIAAGALRNGRPIAAWVAVAVAVMPFPLALMGSVLKDCLMQGALVLGTGVLVWSGAGRGWAARAAIWLLMLFAATLRFNAFLAALPIAIAAMPAAWRATWRRLATAALATAALLVAAMPLANRAIGAEHSDVEWSLAMFDLAGIAVHSGDSRFPAMGIADPVAVARHCYKPDKWDYFSSWADPLCPITFDRLDAVASARDIRPYPTLLGAIVAHPLAYAAHRLAHFNINTRFLVHDEVQGPVPDRATENEYHFRVAPNPGLRAITRATNWSIHSPLGWPIFWIALAAGLLALRRPGAAAVADPLAWSALLYGLGYLPFSVSSELRYHLWTITGTALAAGFLVGEARGAGGVPRGRLLACLAPALLIALLCALWRLT